MGSIQLIFAKKLIHHQLISTKTRRSSSLPTTRCAEFIQTRTTRTMGKWPGNLAVAHSRKSSGFGPACLHIICYVIVLKKVICRHFYPHFCGQRETGVSDVCFSSYLCMMVHMGWAGGGAITFTSTCVQRRCHAA